MEEASYTTVLSAEKKMVIFSLGLLRRNFRTEDERIALLQAFKEQNWIVGVLYQSPRFDQPDADKLKKAAAIDFYDQSPLYSKCFGNCIDIVRSHGVKTEDAVYLEDEEAPLRLLSCFNVKSMQEVAALLPAKEIVEAAPVARPEGVGVEKHEYVLAAA